MNIVFVTPQLTLGGYEKVVINYANAFSQMGHNITIICGFKNNQCVRELDLKVKIVEFKARLRNFVFPLAMYLKKNKVDILYVPFHSYTVVGVLAKKVSKSSAVIYSAEHGFEKEKNKLGLKIIKHFIKSADVLIAVSDKVAKYDGVQFGIDRKKYYVFDNPVFNSYQIIPEVNCKWLCERYEPVLVTAGRLAKDKHIDIPIKIVAEVNKQRSVSLLILGEGPQKSELMKLAADLQIKEKVHFEGFVPNTMSYMQKCDIYLQTSEIESFGNGVVEAQYCNIPAIVTDCGGPVELIKENKYGINIGKYDEDNVIQRGVKAVLDIIEKNIIFPNLEEKAKKYDAANLEGQFLEPYNEYIRKN